MRKLSKAQNALLRALSKNYETWRMPTGDAQHRALCRKGLVLTDYKKEGSSGSVCRLSAEGVQEARARGFLPLYNKGTAWERDHVRADLFSVEQDWLDAVIDPALEIQMEVSNQTIREGATEDACKRASVNVEVLFQAVGRRTVSTLLSRLAAARRLTRRAAPFLEALINKEGMLNDDPEETEQLRSLIRDIEVNQHAED